MSLSLAVILKLKMCIAILATITFTMDLSMENSIMASIIVGGTALLGWLPDRRHV